jgi:hypothetical protein
MSNLRYIMKTSPQDLAQRILERIDEFLLWSGPEALIKERTLTRLKEVLEEDLENGSIDANKIKIV